MIRYEYEKVFEELYKNNDLIGLYKFFDPIKYNKSLFENSLLSLNDKKLLCDIGLPRVVAPNLGFKNYDNAIYFFSSRYENGKNNEELKSNIRLGINDCGDYIGLNLKTGEIKLFNHEFARYRKKDTLKFNNSVEQLFKSIIRYRIYIIYKNSDIKSLDIETEINSLKNDLEKIDKESFNSKNSFWASIVYDL